ncbi:hypothetical protein N5D52_10270 [Pseudomonas sp. GD03860]|uniref:hypothetical protein n=1 Tax=Pseudomonas TaxID=286 RepID=UPI00236325BC|nr:MULTISPECIES: hypothetical protein [Pseudomonas]MDD2056301.1 hypothetical protein [Pseudomonas putida]MDH0637328.1 hypothetical protein [Pseudomonas sp. GD03860]
MSEYIVPLRNVMLLQHALDQGGETICPVQRPEATINAEVMIETDAETHRVTVTFGPQKGSLTLQRDDTAKYQHLRDFIQDLANGRTESGRQSEQAIAMLEALEHLNGLIDANQIAYITPTTDPVHPFGAVVTNDQGDVCAAAKGTCKDHLAEVIRTQLRPKQEGGGGRP